METMVSYSRTGQEILKTMSNGGCIEWITETRDEDQVVDRNALLFARENWHPPGRTCKQSFIGLPSLVLGESAQGPLGNSDGSAALFGLWFHEMETGPLLRLS